MRKSVAPTFCKTESLDAGSTVSRNCFGQSPGRRTPSWVAGGAEHVAAVASGCGPGRWSTGRAQGVRTVQRSESVTFGQYSVANDMDLILSNLAPSRLRPGRVQARLEAHAPPVSSGVRSPCPSPQGFSRGGPHEVRSAFGQPNDPRRKNLLSKNPRLTLLPDLGNGS